ncbi:MAG TPA: hemerythrin domain-containing protein [Caulobacteraceae bacterium]|nr:hemerythrin domain-containing protein [Caulobacteraceae bacterium]
MTSVIEVLHEEHRNIGRLLRVLERQIDIFAAEDAPDYDVIVGVADYFLDFPDLCHHPKEDAIVARLAAAHPDRLAALGDLPGEHRALRQRAISFRETVSALLGETDIARSEIVDAARRFIDAQWAHMRREEEGFLPLADRLLAPADWTAIESELGRRRDPLFGGKVEARFRALGERLLAWAAEDEETPSGNPSASGKTPPT